MSDLDQQDMKVLESGYIQWLPQRDRAGRAVLCWTPGRHVGPLRNRFRAQFWGLMNALRDKETIKKGMVGIVLSVGKIKKRFDGAAALKLHVMARSLPCRFVGGHFCADNNHNRPVVALALKAFSSFQRVRFRTHQGMLLSLFVVAHVDSNTM